MSDPIVPFLIAGGDPTRVPREALRIERHATEPHQPTPRLPAERYMFRGESLTLTEIAERTGINRDRLKSRIRGLGWDVERAASTPSMNKYGARP